MCSIAEPPSLTLNRGAHFPPQSVYAAVIVGVALVVGNVFYGIMNEKSAWPLACYPTFARILRQPETQSIEMTVLSSTGEIIPVEEDRLSQKFSTERWRGLVSHILRTKNFAQLSLRFKALWQVWAQKTSELQQADMIQFYKVTLIAIPERRNANPLKRELILEIKLQVEQDSTVRSIVN